MKSERYIRQTSLKGFGPEKQRLLEQGSVLVVGLGGLGIPVLQYLNAMGVGVLGLVEQDVIELSNLQRQVLYGEPDLGMPKIEVAQAKLREMNSRTRIIAHETFLNARNAMEILSGYDVIVDATDNFGTRYLINDTCVILGKPFVYGAIHGFEGQVSVFNYQNGPTYRCLFPSPPEPGTVQNCTANGVLGVTPGIIGSMQAMEVVKILTHLPGILGGKLLLYNGLDQEIRQIKFPAVPENKSRTTLESSYEQQDCGFVPLVSVRDLKNEITRNPEDVLLIDIRSGEEFSENGLKDAIHVPMENLDEFFRKVPLNKSVYLICNSGTRSLIAAGKLMESRQEIHVFSVTGGMRDWLREFSVIG